MTLAAAKPARAKRQTIVIRDHPVVLPGLSTGQLSAEVTQQIKGLLELAMSLGDSK